MKSGTLFLLIILVVACASAIFIYETVQWYRSLDGQYAKEVVKDPYGDWQDFKSSTSFFSVKLPAMAQNTTEEVADSKNKTKRFYDLYVAEKIDGTLFMITRITFADRSVLNPASKIMQEMIQEIGQSKQGSQIRFINDFSYHGNEGFKFVIDRSDGTYRGLIFHHGPSLYLLSYIDPKKGSDEAEFNYFVNSFLLSN